MGCPYGHAWSTDSFGRYYCVNCGIYFRELEGEERCQQLAKLWKDEWLAREEHKKYGR